MALASGSMDVTPFQFPCANTLRSGGCAHLYNISEESHNIWGYPLVNKSLHTSHHCNTKCNELKNDAQIISCRGKTIVQWHPSMVTYNENTWLAQCCRLHFWIHEKQWTPRSLTQLLQKFTYIWDILNKDRLDLIFLPLLLLVVTPQWGGKREDY